MPRVKQVNRHTGATYYPQALREDMNVGNLSEEDSDLGEFEDEGPSVSQQEWCRDATSEEERQFAKIPAAEYDFKAVVGSGFLPDKPKTAENFRLEVAYPNTLCTPEQVNGWTGAIPDGFTQDVRNLQDCANPVHFLPSTVDYRCRWCKQGYSARNNQYRHEKKCIVPGAPGHKCANHPLDCPKKDKHGHVCKCPSDCAGTGSFSTYKENDQRKNNSRGNIARKRKAP